ncbi:Arm DNA-binding domain-containing protein [Peribacillus butanolivorans]
MAHILKRGDKWAYMVNIAKDSVTGKRRQITKSGFKTKKRGSNCC